MSRNSSLEANELRPCYFPKYQYPVAWMRICSLWLVRVEWQVVMRRGGVSEGNMQEIGLLNFSTICQQLAIRLDGHRSDQASHLRMRLTWLAIIQINRQHKDTSSTVLKGQFYSLLATFASFLQCTGSCRLEAKVCQQSHKTIEETPPTWPRTETGRSFICVIGAFSGRDCSVL